MYSGLSEGSGYDLRTAQSASVRDGRDGVRGAGAVRSAGAVTGSGVGAARVGTTATVRERRWRRAKARRAAGRSGRSGVGGVSATVAAAAECDCGVGSAWVDVERSAAGSTTTTRSASRATAARSDLPAHRTTTASPGINVRAAIFFTASQSLRRLSSRDCSLGSERYAEKSLGGGRLVGICINIHTLVCPSVKIWYVTVGSWQ